MRLNAVVEKLMKKEFFIMPKHITWYDLIINKKKKWCFFSLKRKVLHILVHGVYCGPVQTI